MEERDYLPLAGHNNDDVQQEDDFDPIRELDDLEVAILEDHPFQSSDSSSSDGNEEVQHHPDNPPAQLDPRPQAMGFLERLLSRRRQRHSRTSNTSTGDVRVTFDRSLPGNHSYLGSDLEDVRVEGHSHSMEDNNIVELSCFVCTLGVLVPSQVLPVTLFHSLDVSLLSKIRNDPNGTVAVLGQYKYGTTAQLLSYKEENDDDSGLSFIKAKLIGRQRFEVLHLRRLITGELIAKVCILPNVTNFYPFPTDKSSRRLRLSQFCVPSFTLDVLNPYRLIQNIRKELADWNPSWSLPPVASEDPSLFIWWLLQQLPVPDWLKADLLGTDHPVRCLWRCLSLLRACSGFECSSCRHSITNKSSIFCLTSQGSMGAYVNPGGYVHEMMTVLSADNLALTGRKSTEYSWFPGYAWRIAQCDRCHQHMGWQFTACKSSLSPKMFFGLTRASLIPCLAGESLNNQEEFVKEKNSLRNLMNHNAVLHEARL